MRSKYFQTLDNERNWTDWKYDIIAIINSQNIENAINSTCIPIGDSDIDLFNAKQNMSSKCLSLI